MFCFSHKLSINQCMHLHGLSCAHHQALMSMGDKALQQKLPYYTHHQTDKRTANRSLTTCFRPILRVPYIEIYNMIQISHMGKYTCVYKLDMDRLDHVSLIKSEHLLYTSSITLQYSHFQQYMIPKWTLR